MLGEVEFEVQLVVTADSSLCRQEAKRTAADVVLAVDRWAAWTIRPVQA